MDYSQFYDYIQYVAYNVLFLHLISNTQHKTPLIMWTLEFCQVVYLWQQGFRLQRHVSGLHQIRFIVELLSSV